MEDVRETGRHFSEDELDRLAAQHRWPLAPTHLLPRERWLWWEQLWSDVCALRVCYRLAIRSGWWEDQVQVQSLAALSAWVERYDPGEWMALPGTLALLYDLERLRELLRGSEPFHPDRDRAAFARFLIDAGCQEPPGPIGRARAEPKSCRSGCALGGSEPATRLLHRR